MEGEPSPKKCRLPMEKIEYESAMACGTSSDEDVGDGSFNRRPIRKITLKRKIVQRPSVNNADRPGPNAALGRPSSSMEQQQQQFEESAILWAIDEHGLQHLKNNPHPVVQPSSPSSSSTSSEASSMSDASVGPPPPPVERTSDYSSSDNDSEHLDFMEAAVAVAIQKKGLLPHSVEMSPNR